MNYYSLPLRLGRVIRKEELPACTLEASIANLIHLIVTAHFGENKFDPKFGNVIWENEFGNIAHNNSAREDIKQSVGNGIARYEPRLANVRVEIRWSQEETGASGVKRLSERIDIGIDAMIISSRKPFRHNEYFYIAPLAYN